MSVHRMHVWGLWRPKEGISSPEAGVTVLSHCVEAGNLTQILQKSRCAGKGRVVSPAHKRTETLNPVPAYSQGCPPVHLHREQLALEGRESFSVGEAWGERASRVGSIWTWILHPYCVPTVCQYLLCVRSM